MVHVSRPIICRKKYDNQPLLGPVHNKVGEDERGSNVEDLYTPSAFPSPTCGVEGTMDLSPESAEGVEDGSVGSTLKRSLTVRRESVGSHALLGWGAWSCISGGGTSGRDD